MGKRNANDNGGGHIQNNQHNGGGPNHKRARLNGHHHNNVDISTVNNETLSSSPVLMLDHCDSPKPEFQLSRELVNGTILTDLTKKKWRIGNPIGKGSFGEIFLASDDILSPVTGENAKYVAKIEPHSNGPLFVEIHCLLNTAKHSDEHPLPPGMPEYIASGSHYFKSNRYRFLILKRFDRDLHSIIKSHRIDPKSVLILAVQILDVLQHLHDKGYCHSDIKAENLMISKCTFRKSQIKGNHKMTVNSGGSSSNGEDEDNDEEEDDEEESDDNYKTRGTKKRKTTVQYSGSNPVRSCRLQKRNSTYQEMLKTHYLRPTKKINYAEFFNDDNSKSSHNSEDDFTIDEYITRYRTQRSKRSVTGNQQQQHHSSNHPHRQESHSNSHHKNHNNSKSYILGNQRNHYNNQDYVTEDRIFLIDFGLASKFVDSNGNHRPFCMDQRRAHDGTLEFTSRDAHMGAHSRRSDLECLGYNLIFWSQGYLPWKEIAAQNQPEKVHWMKEYLMADVKEMLKHIYGKSVPKYLGEFMQYVGKLAYDERPDYEKCKRIFIREYIKLGYKEDNMKLDVKEMIKHSVDIKEEIENNNVFEMKNIKSIMKNLGMIMPFRESNSNRVSPKNLRSKSEKDSKKKRKKFSWAEILSQDPDQIARERAEKEFERESTTETPLIKYSGKPTYAILQIENRLKLKDRLDSSVQDENESSILIKGYTKPMMEILKKIQIQRTQQRHRLEEANKKYRTGNHYSQQQQNNYHQYENQQQQNRYLSSSVLSNSFNGSNKNNHHHHHDNIQQHNNKQQLASNINYINNSNNSDNNSKTNKNLNINSKMGRSRAKAGLRTVITPTKRGLDYRNELVHRRTKRRLHKNSGDFTTDESSCSSLNSVASSINNGTNKKSQPDFNHGTKAPSGRHKSVISSNSSSGSNTATSGEGSSSSANSSLSDDETQDSMVVFNSKKVIRNHQQHSSAPSAGGTAATAIYNHNNSNNITSSVNNNINSSSLMSSNNYSSSIIQTRNKRKRSIPQKKNSKGELMRCA